MKSNFLHYRIIGILPQLFANAHNSRGKSADFQHEPIGSKIPTLCRMKKEKHEKQLWVNVEKQVKKFYPDDYTETDLRIAKAFFKAGFNVYPESGYMFQKITQFEDGSYNEASLTIEEARIIERHLSTFENKSDIIVDKQNPQEDV